MSVTVSLSERGPSPFDRLSVTMVPTGAAIEAGFRMGTNYSHKDVRE